MQFFREMEWRLDKEGREYHHYEDFCKLYRAEILNLNRMLDTLMRNGMLPANFQLPTGSLSNVSYNIKWPKSIDLATSYSYNSAVSQSVSQSAI